jgi:MFS family permease
MWTPLMHYYSIGPIEMAHLSAAFIWGYALMSIPAGFLIDSFGVKRCSQISVYLVVFSTFSFFAIKIFWLAVCFRFLMGVFGSFAFLLVLKVIFEKLPLKHRGIYTGMTFAICTLGAVFCDSVLDELSSSYGYLFFASTIIVIGVFLIILMSIIMHEYKSERNHINFIKYIRPLIVKVLILGFIAGVVYLPFTLWQGLWGRSFIINAVGLTKIELVEIMSFMCLGWIVGSIIIGRLADSIKMSPIIGLLLLLQISSYFLMNNFLEGDYSLYVMVNAFIFGFGASSMLLLYLWSGAICNRSPSIGIAIVNSCVTLLICLIFPLIGNILYGRNSRILMDTINSSHYNYIHAKTIISVLLIMAFIAWVVLALISRSDGSDNLRAS